MTAYGLQVTQNSSLIRVRNCTFNNSFDPTVNPQQTTYTGIQYDWCDDVLITGCQFDNLFGAVQIGAVVSQSPGTNSIIQHCTISNAITFAVLCANCIGLLVNQCTMTVGLLNGAPINPFELIGLTDLEFVAQGFVCQDIIIKNCTLSALNAAPGFDNIAIFPSTNVTIEDCILDTNSVVDSNNYHPANIHLVSGSSGIKIIKTTIRGIQERGIFLDGIQVTPGTIENVEIDGCIIDGATIAGISFVSGTQSSIKNSQIVNGLGDGISVGDASNLSLTSPIPTFSTNNLVSGNFISSNQGDGITVGPTGNINNVINNNTVNNNGHGLVIASPNNAIIGNKAMNNTGLGIVNTSTNSQFYDNIAGGNQGGHNYLGVPFIVMQGDPAIAGGNIDS